MYQAVNTRVPNFYFEQREDGVDATQSAELGYLVPKFVNFIKIIPHDHRGEPTEFLFEDWIQIKEREVVNGRYEREWVKEFRNGYEQFKAGREVTRSGLSLLNYGRIAKVRRTELSRQFPTVEDLAAVPDSALGSIGLDGRVLRDLARDDIEAKKGFAPVVKELADANETIKRQEEQLARLAERLDALEAKPRKKQEA